MVNSLLNVISVKLEDTFISLLQRSYLYLTISFDFYVDVYILLL